MDSHMGLRSMQHGGSLEDCTFKTAVCSQTRLSKHMRIVPSGRPRTKLHVPIAKPGVRSILAEDAHHVHRAIVTRAPGQPWDLRAVSEVPVQTIGKVHGSSGP